MRPEYDLSELKGKVRGKYVERFESQPDPSLLSSECSDSASLIGLPNSFEMQHILMNAMGDKDVQKKSE